MARFGIEGIRYFDDLNAADLFQGKKVENLTYVFNVCNGLDRELRDAGHVRAFYWANNNCWEIDLRSVTQGGIDDNWADDVDLFFIFTHGNNDGGDAKLGYNVQIHKWIGTSSEWLLGNNNLEWLLIYGCHSVDLFNPSSFWHIFQRLHELCGAWGQMWDAPSTDEVGEDVGDNLTKGDSICQAWIDGVSDWCYDNHPIVIAVERQETWKGGNYDWPNTTLFRDHLAGYGTTVDDIFPADKYWLSICWAEG